MYYIEFIKNLLIERNLNQKQLAELLGVGESAIGKWLRGERKPTYDYILKFYEKLGIEPNELFGINKDL